MKVNSILLLVLFSQGMIYFTEATNCNNAACVRCSKASDICDACESGYYLDPATKNCLACADGKYTPFFNALSSCSSCSQFSPQPCKKCSGASTCAQCHPGSFISASRCYSCDDNNCAACSMFGKNKCTSCNAGFYLNNSTCTKCSDVHCNSCSEAGTGVCKDCEAGYYVKDGLCVACEDSNCETCSGAGANVCSKCSESYYLTNGECKPCNDAGCGVCSGPGTVKCSACSSGFYFTKSTCKVCSDAGCGVCSGPGIKKCTECQTGFYLLNSTCTVCDDDNCTACSGAGTGKCTSCKANYYLDKQSKTCKACGDGQYSTAGSTECLSLDIPKCMNYSGVMCTKCYPGFAVSQQDGSCSECQEKNCETCDGNDFGKCLTCKTGYTLADDNTCKLTSSVTTVEIDAWIKYQMALEDFLSQGGNATFISQLSQNLGFYNFLIKVTKASNGSVTIKFTIQCPKESSIAEKQEELGQIKAKLDEAVEDGAMNMYPGAIVLDYDSGVTVHTETPPDSEECPSGQYFDSSNQVCQDYPPVTMKSNHLAAILGGALGGAALILAIILIVYYKRRQTTFDSLPSPKSPQSTLCEFPLDFSTSPPAYRTRHNSI